MLDHVQVHPAASARACRTDCRNETPSNTNATANTTYPIEEVRRGLRVDQLLDPMPDRHRRAGHEQSHRGEQRPDVGLPAVSQRVPRLRRSPATCLFAISRKISFPVSAQECADSATIDAEPVSNAATDFAAAISRFAANATHTVTVLCPPQTTPAQSPPAPHPVVGPIPVGTLVHRS